MQGL
ncbi:uncharacterized protein FFNC_15667 [Fusarium fujikuroi]|jgi:hypothetical protein